MIDNNQIINKLLMQQIFRIYCIFPTIQFTKKVLIAKSSNQFSVTKLTVKKLFLWFFRFNGKRADAPFSGWKARCKGWNAITAAWTSFTAFDEFFKANTVAKSPSCSSNA